MSGRVVDRDHRVRQVRWYRGGDIVLVQQQARALFTVLEVIVILDTNVTPELAAEGLARDLVLAVQQARRVPSRALGDRISLQLAGDEVVQAAVGAYADLIKAETLSTQFELPEHLDGTTATVGTGQKIALAVQRIQV